MKKDKKSIKVMPSLFVMIGDTVGAIIGYAILIFLLVYPQAKAQLDESLWLKIGYIFLFGVLPTIIIIGLTIRGFYSVIKIDEKGVSRASFGIFFKKEISWEEMKGMWALYQLQVFVFFSKSVSLDGMTYNKIIKQKGVIQATLSKKVYQAIRRFTDKEIYGVDDDTAKHLHLE